MTTSENVQLIKNIIELTKQGKITWLNNGNSYTTKINKSFAEITKYKKDQYHDRLSYELNFTNYNKIILFGIIGSQGNEDFATSETYHPLEELYQLASVTKDIDLGKEMLDYTDKLLKGEK